MQTITKWDDFGDTVYISCILLQSELYTDLCSVDNKYFCRTSEISRQVPVRSFVTINAATCRGIHSLGGATAGKQLLV